MFMVSCTSLESKNKFSNAYALNHLATKVIHNGEERMLITFQGYHITPIVK